MPDLKLAFHRLGQFILPPFHIPPNASDVSPPDYKERRPGVGLHSSRRSNVRELHRGMGRTSGRETRLVRFGRHALRRQKIFSGLDGLSVTAAASVRGGIPSRCGFRYPITLRGMAPLGRATWTSD
jgi:hypothetical protein